MEEIYVKAKTEKFLSASPEFNSDWRRVSAEGDIMLNTKDLQGVPGETIEERINAIDGIVMNTVEAKVELSKKIWI